MLYLHIWTHLDGRPARRRADGHERPRSGTLRVCAGWREGQTGRRRSEVSLMMSFPSAIMLMLTATLKFQIWPFLWCGSEGFYVLLAGATGCLDESVFVLYVPFPLVSTAVSMRPRSIRIDISDSCERFPSKCCLLNLSTLHFYTNFSRGLTVQTSDLL